MKVYGVFLTDEWESRTSEDYVGFFSTPVLARDGVGETLTHNSGSKAVIEEITLDEVGSEKKLEVYCFKNGLEWKSERSDAELGFNPVQHNLTQEQ